MIELKQNKIWSDSLNSILEFNEPWDYVDEHLYKFICFGAGDAGADGADGGPAADDIGFAAPPSAPVGPEDITSDEDVDPDDPPAPSTGYGGEVGPLGGGPLGQSDDTGIISAAEEEAFDTETLATTGSFTGFAGSFFGSEDDEEDESIEDLDPGEFPGEQGPFGTSGGKGSVVDIGFHTPKTKEQLEKEQREKQTQLEKERGKLAPITKVVEVIDRPIFQLPDKEQQEQGKELDIGKFNPLGNVEDQDDDLFNALATDKGLQEFEAISKAEREATKARGFPEPPAHRGPQHDPTITDTDIETMMDDISSKFGIAPSLLSLAMNALGLGLPSVLSAAKSGSQALGMLDPNQDNFFGFLGALGKIASLPFTAVEKATNKVAEMMGLDFMTTPLVSLNVAPTTTNLGTPFGTIGPTIGIGKGNVPGIGKGPATGQEVAEALTMAGNPETQGVFGIADDMANAPVGVADPGFGGSEVGVSGEKYGGQIGKKYGGLVSLRKAYNGGNISGLASTGTNIIDTINRGLAMPPDIGAVQMQEKLEVNPNNPYTNR